MKQRLSVMVASDPWTLLITLENDPDSLGCWVHVQEMTMDGTTSDGWDRFFPRVEEALREMEMAYGVGPGDWLDMDQPNGGPQ